MGLEEKVEDKESKGFIKKALNLGFKGLLATGATLFSLAAVGNLGVIVGGAFAGGIGIGALVKKKPLYDAINEALKAYTAVNAVIYPVVKFGDLTYPLIANADFTGKVLRGIYALTVHNAFFVGAYNAAAHLFDHYLNPKGIWSSVKHNFYNTWKRIGLLFAPAYVLAANGVTELGLRMADTLYKIPTFAANAFPVGFANQIWPIPEKKY